MAFAHRGMALLVAWALLARGSGSSLGSNRTQAPAMQRGANSTRLGGRESRQLGHHHHVHVNSDAEPSRRIISLAAAKRHKEIVSLSRGPPLPSF